MHVYCIAMHLEAMKIWEFKHDLKTKTLFAFILFWNLPILWQSVPVVWCLFEKRHPPYTAVGDLKKLVLIITRI